MNLLILGRGKTGSLVADMARERRHHVQVLSGADNADARALASEINLTFVIDEDDASEVVRRLHHAFFAEADPEVFA